MLTKAKLAFAAAVIVLCAGSAAQAANDNQSDPARGASTGPEGQKQGGSAVNPAVHHSGHHAAMHHQKLVAKKDRKKDVKRTS
jgi:hypothetical protein